MVAGRDAESDVVASMTVCGLWLAHPTEITYLFKVIWQPINESAHLKAMAFAALLASVPDDQVVAFREERRRLLEADLLIRCSHVLTSWVQPTELRDSLRQAIDGGQNLRCDLWHPLRKPVWHPSIAIAEIEPQLRRVWNDLLMKHGPADPKDWYVIEISKVLHLFRHAFLSHSGVVSFLDQPMDHERAAKVLIPVIERPANDSLPN
jgi:hypothetical protein